MRASQFIVEGAQENANVVEMFKKFLPLAMKILELDSLPKMEFVTKVDETDQPTFGLYSNSDRVLKVALLNRHPNDILRTVAHELTHYKQDINNELNNDSGDTGSDHENEANATAGVIMRHFNKLYPEYLRSRPL
jgi:hypothetical protein